MPAIKRLDFFPVSVDYCDVRQKNMNRLPALDSCRPQTVIALIQCGAIIAGCIATGVILKIFGYSGGQDIPLLVLFVRNWGFLLIAIPLAWVLITAWMEERRGWYSQRVTILSGLVLLVLMCWFLIYVAGRAASVMMRMGN